MGRFTAHQSARSRFRNRILTSFTSAWAKAAFAAISCKATAFTNRPMRGRRGHTSDSQIRSRSRASEFIPQILTSFTSPRLAIRLGPMRNAACFVRRTVARRGARSFSVITKPARLISPSIETIRTFCTRLCGRRIACRGRCRAAGPAVAFSNLRTAVTPGLRSRGTKACPQELLDVSALAFQAAIQIASMRLSRTKTAVCSVLTTPERPGRRSARIGDCVNARSTTRTSLPIQRTATRSMC